MRTKRVLPEQGPVPVVEPAEGVAGVAGRAKGTDVSRKQQRCNRAPAFCVV